MTVEMVAAAVRLENTASEAVAKMAGQTAQGLLGFVAGRAALFGGPRFPTERADWPIRASRLRCASVPAPRMQRLQQHLLQALERSGERVRSTLS